jgi:hypothetical protein
LFTPRDVAVLVALETVVMNPFLGVFFGFRHETVVFSQADKAVNLCVVVSGGGAAGGGGLVDEGLSCGAGGRTAVFGAVRGGVLVGMLVGAVGVVDASSCRPISFHGFHG